MTRKVDKFFNNETMIEQISAEIAEIFVQDANSDNLEYSFDIAKGTGKVKTRQANTFFSFDSTPNTLLDAFKKALFDEELGMLSDKKEEELVLSIKEFSQKVAEHINLNHNDKIRQTIRKVVLPKSRSKDIPLDEITINSIEVADFSSVPEPAKYLLKIGKAPDTEIKTDELTKYIHTQQEETNKTVQEIFYENRDTNPLFSNVISLERGMKYLFDVSIALFVDYSLSSLPPKN